MNGSSCLFPYFLTFKKLPISPGQVPLALLGVTQYTGVPLFIPYSHFMMGYLAVAIKILQDAR